jgi:serine/threonine protein kinase
MAVEPLTGDDPAEADGYRLVARLGRGGMGRVYLAVTGAGLPVALKVMRAEFGDDREFRARFRREVDAARRVHGRYTVQVLDAGPDASPPWLVTAYIPGPSLGEAVTRHGPLPADTVLLMMAGVAEALQAIHAAGVVHGDLKPSNVLLAADGPRVTGFGIARAAEATSVTRTGMFPGAPPFMAPEQATGLPVSAATDVFSLGSVAAYAALGRTPFGEGNSAAMLYRVAHAEPDLSGCPPQLSDVIGNCLAKDAAQRPSPAEIITRCRAYTAGRTLQAWLPAEVAAGMTQHARPAPGAITPERPQAFPLPGPATAQPSGAPMASAGDPSGGRSSLASPR